MMQNTFRAQIVSTPLRSRSLLAYKSFPYSAGKPFQIASAKAFSTSERKKKQKKTVGINLVPLKSIGVLTDFYVPPKLLSCPVTSWHKLILRRIGLFGINTYAISKFKNETKLKLKFNDWKEQAVEKYVKTNKIFAAACSLPRNKRDLYLLTQLDGIAGKEMIKCLAARAKTFPVGQKLNWRLLGVESNPKLVSFIPLPDANEITALVQFVVQVKTKQEMIVSGDATSEPSRTEKIVTDNIVMTMNPFTEEIVFVGTVFESDHIRGVKPELAMDDQRAVENYSRACADIYRAPPPVKS